jgi:thymidylate synthase
MQLRPQSFSIIHRQLAELLSNTPGRVVGEWHSQKTAIQFLEVFNVSFAYTIPARTEYLIEDVKPNLPWAEKHFQERISGKPLNPPPSSIEWPFMQAGHKLHVDERGQFSHTYPERYWPKYANTEEDDSNWGIRFRYGDLQDVVNLLSDSPLTRQAYLPVWFPEDTGVVMGQRVPCSLGYQFFVREDRLHCVYFMRSCDFYRHFRDDIYMTARLMQWIAEKLGSIPGVLTTHIVNLHAFETDRLQLMHDSKSVLDQMSIGDGYVADL